MTKLPIHATLNDEAVWRYVWKEVEGTRLADYNVGDSELTWVHDYVAIATLYDPEGIFLGIVTVRWDPEDETTTCNVVLRYH